MPASMLVNKTDKGPIPAVLYCGRGKSITHNKSKQKNRNISDSGKRYEKINRIIRKGPTEGYLSQVKTGL